MPLLKSQVRLQTCLSLTYALTARPARRSSENDHGNRIQRRNSRFFFYNFLTAPRTVSNSYARVARTQLCANHVQHVERVSRATCCVTWYEGTARLLSLMEVFFFFFFSVPQLYLWGSPLLGEIFAYVTVF